eukprot:1896095-Rhodomonas_salina.1
MGNLSDDHNLVLSNCVSNLKIMEKRMAATGLYTTWPAMESARAAKAGRVFTLCTGCCNVGCGYPGTRGTRIEVHSIKYQSVPIRIPKTFLK